jgi:hypothetical protein
MDCCSHAVQEQVTNSNIAPHGWRRGCVCVCVCVCVRAFGGGGGAGTKVLLTMSGVKVTRVGRTTAEPPRGTKVSTVTVRWNAVNDISNATSTTVR